MLKSVYCYVKLVECGEKCLSSCKAQGANKCDSQCSAGYSLFKNDYLVSGSNYTCTSTLDFNVTS